ncbi:MAG TPA: helix-hairpin-helix domain-containing protein [Saprospiraceae bacterium]|nr:helix-hairpin-helix domain-containing protein [Saprospiraceae bacterium]
MSRSGDVIPTIVDVIVDSSIEPIFPPENLGWHWKGSDIVLDNPDASKTVQIKRIEHFFVTIGVPRLREKTIEKLWYAGYKDIKAITNAKPSDLIKIKGIGKKTSESHYKNIHETMRTTRLDRYIPASTTLSLGIGRKLVKQLMRYHPTILEDSSDVIQRMLKKKEIPGFGTKRIANVAENVPKFRDFLFSLNKEDIEYALKKDKERRDNLKKGGFNQNIRGKTFVLTGFYGNLDLNIEDYIYDNLGNFSDSVTSLTEAVVAANILDFSKKMEAALKLGVPVLSLDEFIKKYNIPKKTARDDEDGEIIEEHELGVVEDPEAE